MTSVGSSPLGNASHPSASESSASRRDGRALAIAIYGASRTMKLYPVEHQGVQRALRDLADLAESFHSDDGELEVRMGGELLFVNGTRMRLDLSSYAAVGHVLAMLRAVGIGTLRVQPGSTPRDWTVLLSLLEQERTAPTDESLENVTTRLAQGGVSAFELDPLEKTRVLARILRKHRKPVNARMRNPSSLPRKSLILYVWAARPASRSSSAWCRGLSMKC